MSPKVLVLFRNDDLCAWSNPLHEERLLRLFDAYNVPMTLGVVPKIRGWRLDDNRSVLSLLERAKAAGHELALHGLEHDHHEFEHLPIDELWHRLEEGQQLMKEWFGEPVTTFIPPDNAWVAEFLPSLQDLGISALSSGLPFKPLPSSSPVFIVDAIARFLFAPLPVLVRHLASLSLATPLPLVIYFHSWEVYRKPHWKQMELLLRTVVETPGVVALTFSEAVRRYPEALRFWSAWRQDKHLVQRCNVAFQARSLYRARMWHRYWRDLWEGSFPVPALERWMVRAYTAALTGNVVELERIVTSPLEGWVKATMAERVATLIGWAPLAVLGSIQRFVRPRRIGKIEDAFNAPSSRWLATVAFRPNASSTQSLITHSASPITGGALRPANDDSRSLIYLSFDRRLVSEHAAMTSKALVKRGWRVTFVHPQGAPWSATPDGLRRVEVGAKMTRSVWDWSAQQEMAQLIARWKPPVIYARQHWIGLLPPFIARRLGIPYVAEFNGLRHRGILARHPQSLKGRAIRWLECWCAKQATAIVVPSKSLAKRVAHLLGTTVAIHDLTPFVHDTSQFVHPTIFVVPNGIDPNIFHPVPQEEARRWLGLPPKELYVSYTGSLHIWQGVDVLLHAFAQLVRRFPNCHLLIVGGQDEPQKDAYKHLARELRITDYTHFVPFVPYEQSALYIAAADVCVAPYVPICQEFGGGSPLKLYAYLSCGRPVVLSDLGDFVDADLVRTSGAGLLVPPGDPEALAEAIGQLLADPTLRAEMGQRGREAILNGYTWDHNAMRVESVLESVMDQAR